MDMLGSMEGPGQVWGAEGIAVGKEEADFKGYDNFGLFFNKLRSSAIGSTLSGPGPFTVFAPTDSAVETYEKMIGPFDDRVIALHIVPGMISSGSLGSANLATLAGVPLTYKRQFRKDFVNDSIVGEKTFGPFADFPTDVMCDNGIIHAVGLCLSS